LVVGRKKRGRGGIDTGLCHECSLREGKVIMNDQLQNI
jgi:hypothetical protein